ncbi:hypothetical protein Q8A73_003988 [Channa argus]|nr:hypothetical protein Q8A73_003988 [Channa argus]
MTNTTPIPDGTTVTPESTNATAVPDVTTVTPESTNATAVPDVTTVTPESTNTTKIPDATSVTPESTITTMIPDGTTVTTESTNATTVSDNTSVTPEMTNKTTVPDGSTVTPESTNTTMIPDSTTVTPESTNTTMIPDSTSVTPESTITTMIPDGTTVAPDSTNATAVPDVTTVTPESTNATAVPDVTPVTPESTNTTKIPDATSVTPESTITTMIPDGTSVTTESTNATKIPDATTVTPESTNTTMIPDGTSVTPESTITTMIPDAGKPKASTRCSTKNGPPSFDCPLQKLQCDQTLSDIQQNLTSAADLETLASSTQILTSKPEELTAENVTAAAQIVNTLLLSPNATESVRVAAVATVSQLLNASVPDNTEENDATVGLTLTLDQLSVNLSSSLNASQSQVVQPNLVVQSAQIPAVDTQGVQFTSLTGTSGSFVANRIQLNTNASKAVVENGFIADALIYIRFPAAAGSRQQPSNVSLGFVLYQNDRFFRSSLYRSRRTSVRVLSASVRGQERSVVPQHVEMMFRPTVMNGTSLYDFACVFWNYSLEDWSTVSCSKGNASDGVLRCFCNHTTNFAALWSIREKYEYAEALGVISIVGLSISIVGLIITIIHHIKVKFWRKSHKHQDMNAKLTLLCIYVSLLAFIITFLSGVNNPSRQDDAQAEIGEANIIPGSDEHVDPDRGSCSAVAALLHFFLLATFMWNSVYGTQLLLLIQTMHRSLSSYWTLVSFAVGWGVPAIVMVITLAATYSVENPLGYRQEEFCWLAALSKDKQFHFGKPMFWGFLLPIGLILIYNMVLLVLVSVTTCRTDPKLTSTHQRSLKKKFLTSFSLAVILGLSWTLGYLVLASTGHLHLVFSILFCLCTTTQGFQIFILFTARTPSFRAAVSRFFHHVSSVNIPLRTTRYSFTNCSGDTSRGTESYRDLREQYTSKNLSFCLLIVCSQITKVYAVVAGTRKARDRWMQVLDLHPPMWDHWWWDVSRGDSLIEDQLTPILTHSNLLLNTLRVSL